MSDTPRTDAAEVKLREHDTTYFVVDSDFSRSLERELAVAENALIKINKHKDDVLQRGMVANEALRRLAEMRKESGK